MTGLRLRNKSNHNTSMVLNFSFSLRCKYVEFMLIFALMSLIFKVPVKS